MKEMKKVSLVLSYADFHMILFWQFPFLSNIIAIIRIGGIQLGEELFQLPKPQKRRKP